MTEHLDETYARLHRFGPEYGGDEEGNHGLTNHGPMVAEVIVRRGLDIDLDRWTDRYRRRLSDLPAPRNPIRAGWREALGDATRLPDWTDYFHRQVREQPWTDVLDAWWPRLLPGIIAGSTHGVIRVGHAVRTLARQADPSATALDELGHGLAFWAARFRPVHGAVEPAGHLDPAQAISAISLLPDRGSRIAERLDQLERTTAWPASQRALQPALSAPDVIERLDDLITAAIHHYARYGHGAPVLLVHTATAPNAVRHVLPYLRHDLWVPSLAAAWTASAAVIAAYAPPEPSAAPAVAGMTAAAGLDRAAAHGDEHVIKFADTAVDAYDRTSDPELLAATVRAASLIERPDSR